MCTFIYPVCEHKRLSDGKMFIIDTEDEMIHIVRRKFSSTLYHYRNVKTFSLICMRILISTNDTLAN